MEEISAEEIPKVSTTNVVQDNKNEVRTDVPHQDHPKKKKEDRKKDDKSVEQFMKSLNSVPSLEEKLSLVCKKYVQTADDSKKLQFYIKQSDKRYALLLKEKEQLQHEYNKTVLVKSKLENLCRELQKQNKAIKEESLLRIREEEERRKETQAKFQSTLTEITAMLQQNNEKNTKLRDDNISMGEKFQSVLTQYQLREQQVDKMSKQMALESQLADAKLQKAGLEHRAERERLVAEIETLKLALAQAGAKINEMQGAETSLKGQLSIYTEKYDEFQNALVKSNQLFGGFKEQMEQMSKKIKKLEKESLTWKNRWETSQSALLDMVSERQAGEERATQLARQLHHMQSLCRTLQSERTVLLGTLKENNIERPPLPAAPAPLPPPAPQPQSNAKVDAMAANCVQLRQSLAHLQSQLNTLTNKKDGKEDTPKPETKKKTKSKKNKDKQTQPTPANNTEEITSEDVKLEIVESPNETTPENNQPSAIENKVQNDLDNSLEKVDEKTLDSLIQAISNANISLCDLKVDDDADLNNGASDEINENLPSENTESNTGSADQLTADTKDKLNLSNEEISSNNVSIVEGVNDEVGQLPEVKPIMVDN